MSQMPSYVCKPSTYVEVYSPLDKNVLGKIIDAVVNGGAKRAVKYISPDLIFRATFIGKRRDAISGKDIRISIGSPNYKERRHIEQFLTAGEKFPIKKIQMQFVKNP